MICSASLFPAGRNYDFIVFPSTSCIPINVRRDYVACAWRLHTPRSSLDPSLLQKDGSAISVYKAVELLGEDSSRRANRITDEAGVPNFGCIHLQQSREFRRTNHLQVYPYVDWPGSSSTRLRLLTDITRKDAKRMREHVS